MSAITVSEAAAAYIGAATIVQGDFAEWKRKTIGRRA